jgi:hypothetical protein
LSAVGSDEELRRLEEVNFLTRNDERRWRAAYIRVRDREGKEEIKNVQNILLCPVGGGGGIE